MVFLCCSPDANYTATAKDTAKKQSDDGTVPLPTMEEFEPEKERMRQMAIIGHITPTTARVWVKVPSVGTYVLCISPKPFLGNSSDLYDLGGEEVATYFAGKCVTRSHKFDDPEMLNHCYHFSDLEEDTTYYYILCAEKGTEVSGSCRTVLGDSSQEYFSTAKSDPSEISVCAFSCHDPYSWTADEANTGAWPQLFSVRDDIDVCLAGGDQIYVDSNEIGCTDLWVFMRDNLAAFKANYYSNGKIIDEDGLREYLTKLIRQYYDIYWNIPSLQGVMGRVPMYMIWE